MGQTGCELPQLLHTEFGKGVTLQRETLFHHAKRVGTYFTFAKGISSTKVVPAEFGNPVVVSSVLVVPHTCWTAIQFRSSFCVWIFIHAETALCGHFSYCDMDKRPKVEKVQPKKKPATNIDLSSKWKVPDSLMNVLSSSRQDYCCLPSKRVGYVLKNRGEVFYKSFALSRSTVQ